MARTTNITFDQVAAAANAIKAAGDKPTARRIRDALGTGSMATILRFFQQWQGGSAEAVDGEEGQEITLDPAIIKAITTAIAAQVAAAGIDAAQTIANQQGEIAALVQENERLNADMENLEAVLDDMKNRAATLTGQRDAIRAEKDRLEVVIEQERAGRIAAEQSAAVLAAQKADAENRAEEARTREGQYRDLLLQSQLKAEQLGHELTAELRRKTKSKPVEKTETLDQLKPSKPTAKKPRPSRAKTKAAPATN